MISLYEQISLKLFPGWRLKAADFIWLPVNQSEPKPCRKNKQEATISGAGAGGAGGGDLWPHLLCLWQLSARLSPSVVCQLTGEKINALAEVCLQLEGEFRFCHTRLHLKTTRLKALWWLHVSNRRAADWGQSFLDSDVFLQWGGLNRDELKRRHFETVKFQKCKIN